MIDAAPKPEAFAGAPLAEIALASTTGCVAVMSQDTTVTTRAVVAASRRSRGAPVHRAVMGKRYLVQCERLGNSMIDLRGKRARVAGVADDHSIAWASPRRCGRWGRTSRSLPNEKAEPHARPLAESTSAPIIMQLEVTREEHEEPRFLKIREVWGRRHIVGRRGRKSRIRR